MVPALLSTMLTPVPGRIAVIGDYGFASPGLAGVAKLVNGWRPEYIVTTGDNNYDGGSASTIDRNIGQYFAPYIGAYRGRYGPGSSRNRFFPVLGNHDWGDKGNNPHGADPYLSYFSLPGNERYYDVVLGKVHLFVVDSDRNEPDGNSASSVQARWLEGRMKASKARWKVVAFHHPPYSGGESGSAPHMRWPFREWGANLVLSGHDHTYQRIQYQGLTYIVNGLGGARRYALKQKVPGTAVWFSAEHGAMVLEPSERSLKGRFVTSAGKVVDTFSVD